MRVPPEKGLPCMKTSQSASRLSRDASRPRLTRPSVLFKRLLVCNVSVATEETGPEADLHNAREGRQLVELLRGTLLDEHV